MRHASESKNASGREDMPDPPIVCKFSGIVQFFNDLPPGDWYIRKETSGVKSEATKVTAWNDAGEIRNFES